MPRSSEAAAARPWTLPGFPARAYSHLLGVYLGDGCISIEPRTAVLRIFFDAAYPRLISDAVNDVRALHPDGRVHVARRVPTRCVVVSARWVRWPLIFPQHGAGRKHDRAIVLAAWQRALTRAHPEEFIRGLLNSDGCRYVNRVRVKDTDYAYPSYQFTNRSDDIKGLLCQHLDQLGITWRRASSRNIAVTRRKSVERLDAFVGPKR